MKDLAIGAAVLAGLAIAALYTVRTLTPTQSSVDEGHAFSAVNDKMMSAMMGATVKYSGNPDDDFAMLMIPHHQGAVDMAVVEDKYGTDPVIRALAQRIAGAQVPQIEQMTKWRAAHPSAAATADAAAEQQAYMDVNVKMMNGMMGEGMGHSGNADRDFVEMMIPHHQGAVDMGEVELKYGQDPELRALAQVIMASQTAEIIEMRNWLRTHGN